MNKGKMSENGLKNSVLRTIEKYNKRSGACIGADAGRFESEECDFMMSSATVTGDEERNGELAVLRAVNSMAAAGGKSLCVAFSVVAPENDPYTFTKRVMNEAARAAGLCGAEIINGNTTVYTAPSVTAVVTGKKFIDLKHLNKDTERIMIMCGNAGTMGAAMLAARFKDKLLTRLTAEYIEKALVDSDEITVAQRIKEVLAATDGAAAIHDVSEGGVFGAIWELCEREKAGCEIDLKKVPIKQATVEVCEILDVSPFQLRGDGAFIAIVQDTPENRALGTVIGTVTDSNDRVVINGEEKRFLEPNRIDTYYTI